MEVQAVEQRGKLRRKRPGDSCPFPATARRVEWLNRLVGNKRTTGGGAWPNSGSRTGAWISGPDWRSVRGEVFSDKASTKR